MSLSDMGRRTGITALAASLFIAALLRPTAALGQTADQPDETAAVQDACPEGSVGSPPVCFAVTGDTSPLLTSVVTPAMLADRAPDENSTVHGETFTEPLGDFP
jgi:hypothetical protein